MVIKQDFNYYPTGKQRRLHIYLPDEYYDTAEKYPVMYFFDGHNLFFNSDATYGKSWGMKEFLDGWDKRMIIVGIECGHGEGERLSEYLPYRAEWGFLSGREPLGEATVRWIAEEIKPYIDTNYRTWSHREATAIGGSSMGGIMALFAAVRFNSVFSKAACVSSALGFCIDEVERDIDNCDISPDTRVWLSWGTGEAQGDGTYNNNRRVEDHLLRRNALPALFCQVGGNHCEADWEKQVPHIMNYLWK